MELRKHKYRDLATNTLIFTISSFASKLLVFFLVPLYTSVLSTEEYGFADLISTTASLLIFILTLNISDSVLRFAIDRTEGQENILSYGLKIQINGTILLSVVLLIIDRLHVFVIDSYYYIFLLLLFFFNAIHQTASNYLRAINKLKAVAISGVVQTLTIICSNIFFLLVLKIGVKGYILSILLGSIVSTLYSFLNFDTSLLVIIKSKCDKSTRNEMIKYSVPLIFNSVAWWMNNSIDKYFLISILNASANGLYAVSYKIPSILTMVNQIFAQAWSLSAIKEFDKNDKDGFFAQIYSLYNATMVICCSILIILNVFLARIMYAKDFF
jgi:O-antigen/teichoic acid export membrane protein